MELIKCPLCGLEFGEDEAAEVSCKSCPLFRECNVVKCPNCGYEFPKPREIKILSRLSNMRLRIWRR